MTILSRNVSKKVTLFQSCQGLRFQNLCKQILDSPRLPGSKEAEQSLEFACLGGAHLESLSDWESAGVRSIEDMKHGKLGKLFLFNLPHLIKTCQ